MKYLTPAVLVGLVLSATTVCAGNYGSRVVVKNVLVQTNGGSFSADIVAGNVQESASQIFFGDLRLVAKNGVEYALLNENNMLAERSLLLVEDAICGQAAPASYRKYRQSSPGNNRDIKGNAVLFLKDGSVVESQTSEIPAYTFRKNVTCSKTALDHIGE